VATEEAVVAIRVAHGICIPGDIGANRGVIIEKIAMMVRVAIRVVESRVVIAYSTAIPHSSRLDTTKSSLPTAAAVISALLIHYLLEFRILFSLVFCEITMITSPRWLINPY